jgi:hypothetical protein
LFVGVATFELGHAAINGQRYLTDLFAQLLQDPKGVCISLTPHVRCLAHRPIFNIGGASLGGSHQAVLSDPFGGLGIGFAQDLICFRLGLSQDLIAFLGQTAGRFELVRDGHADLIEDIENLLLVD